MQWEGPAEVPVDLILFRWINFHLGKVLLPRLRLAPSSSVRLPQPRRTSLCAGRAPAGLTRCTRRAQAPPWLPWAGSCAGAFLGASNR